MTAQLLERTYRRKIRVTKQEMKVVQVIRHKECPNRNDTIKRRRGEASRHKELPPENADLFLDAPQGRLSKHTNPTIQPDLKAAGISHRDASDRVVDFHTLRHTFIAALVISKAPVKVIQSLARHPPATLTFGI